MTKTIWNQHKNTEIVIHILLLWSSIVHPYYHLPYSLLYNTTDLVVNEKSRIPKLKYLYKFRHVTNLANKVTIQSNICKITTISSSIAKQYDQEEEERHKVTSPNTPNMVRKIPAIYMVLSFYFVYTYMIIYYLQL